ncbi:MAG: hypothetical protein ACK5AS_00485 [Bacteroidota bacterium]
MKRFISYLLLFILISGITPRELIHLGHNHTDTECHTDSQKAHIESIHKHCSFLLLQLGFGITNNPVYDPPICSINYALIHPQSEFIFISPINSSYLRGPPTV